MLNQFIFSPSHISWVAEVIPLLMAIFYGEFRREQRLWQPQRYSRIVSTRNDRIGKDREASLQFCQSMMLFCHMRRRLPGSNETTKSKVSANLWKSGNKHTGEKGGKKGESLAQTPQRGRRKKVKQPFTYTSQNRISVNTRETFFVLRPRLLVSAVLRLSRRQGRLLG